MKAIANELGCDQYAFSKQFKKVIGMSPRAVMRRGPELIWPAGDHVSVTCRINSYRYAIAATHGVSQCPL